MSEFALNFGKEKTEEIIKAALALRYEDMNKTCELLKSAKALIPIWYNEINKKCSLLSGETVSHEQMDEFAEFYFSLNYENQCNEIVESLNLIYTGTGRKDNKKVSS